MLQKENNILRVRETWIDVLKGLGIILVIIGHGSISPSITNIIYMFHMPLFFFISGYLDMNTKSFYELLTKKSKRLLYPYFTFGCLIICYNSVIDLLRDKFTYLELNKRIIALFYGNFIWENNYSYIGTLWFLACLFSVSLIYKFIKIKSERNQKSLYWITISFTLIGIILNRYCVATKLRLPFGLDIAMIAIFFYALGSMIKSYNKMKQSTVKSVFYIVLGMLLGIFNTKYMINNNFQITRIDMLKMNYGLELLFMPSASLIILGLHLILKEIHSNKFTYLLERYGQLSILIMIIHLYLFPIINFLTKRIVHININAICITIINIVVSFVISIFIEKYFPKLYKI